MLLTASIFYGTLLITDNNILLNFTTIVPKFYYGLMVYAFSFCI